MRISIIALSGGRFIYDMENLISSYIEIRAKIIAIAIIEFFSSERFLKFDIAPKNTSTSISLLNPLYAPSGITANVRDRNSRSRYKSKKAVINLISLNSFLVNGGCFFEIILKFN